MVLKGATSPNQAEKLGQLAAQDCSTSEICWTPLRAGLSRFLSDSYMRQTPGFSEQTAMLCARSPRHASRSASIFIVLSSSIAQSSDVIDNRLLNMLRVDSACAICCSSKG